MEHGEILLYVLLMLFGIFLFVILQSYLIGLSTVGWTFLGHDEVALMLPILPYLFLITLIIVPAYYIVQEAEN